MPKKKTEEESMAEEIGYKEPADLMTEEEMKKYAQERAARAKMDKTMNRRTLYGDKYGFTEKARKNLANDPRY